MKKQSKKDEEILGKVLRGYIEGKKLVLTAKLNKRGTKFLKDNPDCFVSIEYSYMES